MIPAPMPARAAREQPTVVMTATGRHKFLHLRRYCLRDWDWPFRKVTGTRLGAQNRRRAWQVGGHSEDGVRWRTGRLRSAHEWQLVKSACVPQLDAVFVVGVLMREVGVRVGRERRSFEVVLGTFLTVHRHARVRGATADELRSIVSAEAREAKTFVCLGRGLMSRCCNGRDERLQILPNRGHRT